MAEWLYPKTNEDDMEPAMRSAYLLGEIIQQDNRPSIRDMLGGETYPISAHLNTTPLSVGDIIAYGAEDGAVASIQLLAETNSAVARLYRIVADKKLNPFFPVSVIDETNAILANPGINDPALVDLEHLAFCTIDGKDTQDLDQALHIAEHESGFVVRYAIADAAYYIKPETALFEQALQRGASFYLPGLMIPLLPRDLCTGVISLNENVCRRAIIFEMHLDTTGRLQHATIVQARIKSRAKLSFAEVQEFLDSPAAPIRDDRDLADSLRLFQQVGKLRIQLAEERNVARYHRTDINVSLAQNGLTFKLLDNVRNDIELYNEQLSLLCNTVGAQILADGEDEAIARHIQPIYKVHPPPSTDKLQELEHTIDRLIEMHQLDRQHWQWRHDSDTSLAEYLKRLPSEGRHAGLTLAINRQAIMANTRSSFSEQAEQHYGVGASVYARFSSPMREMVGIFLHKELQEKVSGRVFHDLEQEDETLRDQVIKTANRAKDIQRQLTNEANLLVMDQVFSKDLNQPPTQRPVRQGTVIGVGKNKLYILLTNLSIEIKLHIESLETQWQKDLFIDQERRSLYAKSDNQALINLGDNVSVMVTGHDPNKQRWIFTVPHLCSPENQNLVS